MTRYYMQLEPGDEILDGDIHTGEMLDAMFIRDVDKYVENLQAENERLLKRCEIAESLVRHAWVHAGYSDCGSSQMTTEQRDYYRQIADTQPDAGEGGDE